MLLPFFSKRAAKKYLVERLKARVFGSAKILDNKMTEFEIIRLVHEKGYSYCMSIGSPQ